MLILGIAFLVNTPKLRALMFTGLRSERLGWLTMGIGGAWFLWKIYHLSPADFGQYRNILLLVFGATWLGSFFLVKDFLSVRGAAVTFMLLALLGLKAAFGHYEIPQRLFFVSFLYVGIILAIFLGASPFYLRNFLEWLNKDPLKPRLLGGFVAAYGSLLLIVAFTY